MAVEQTDRWRSADEQAAYVDPGSHGSLSKPGPHPAEKNM